MRKTIIFLLVLALLIPGFVFATINQNLYYGLTGNSGVTELQEFLISKGFLTGRATGNFYSLTLSAVKQYQTSKQINPTGYVGSLTRQAIAQDLSNTSTTPNNLAPTVFSGYLLLTKNTKYANQSFSIPQQNIKFADFNLQNKTTESVNINNIEVDLVVGANLSTANQYVNNLYVSYGDKKTSTLTTVALKNNWQPDLLLLAGQTISFSVYGDINSSIPLGSTIKASMLVSGVSVNSKTAVSTNSNVVLVGQTATFNTGTLAIVADSQTPATRIVLARQRVVAGKFTLTSARDSYTVSSLKFVLPSYPNTSIISGAVLIDSNTQEILTQNPIPVIYTNRKHVLNFDNLNIAVDLNTSRGITLSYDLGAVASPGDSNSSLYPALVYVVAKSNRNVLIDGVASDYSSITSVLYSGITLPAKGIVFKDLYALKNVPKLSSSAEKRNASSGSRADIYNFKITADSGGNITVKQIKFIVTIKDPNNISAHINSLSFFKNDVDYSSSVIIGRNVNSNYIGLSSNNGVGVGTNTVVVSFNKEEIIPAGTTNSYSLKASFERFTTTAKKGAATVTAYIPADTAFSSAGYLRAPFMPIYGLAQEPASVYITDYNFLWSDMSATGFPAHSDVNGFSTKDWHNGFGVPGLALPSQTITAK